MRIRLGVRVHLGRASDHTTSTTTTTTNDDDYDYHWLTCLGILFFAHYKVEAPDIDRAVDSATLPPVLALPDIDRALLRHASPCLEQIEVYSR